MFERFALFLPFLSSFLRKTSLLLYLSLSYAPTYAPLTPSFPLPSLLFSVFVCRFFLVSSSLSSLLPLIHLPSISPSTVCSLSPIFIAPS
ncbi:hypothetical protein BDQ17DRAFT_1363404 [Cyathus striatus]|nr:hypothetical protein BDQ17DRAFT_1363404 [Cyathus striatus]